MNSSITSKIIKVAFVVFAFVCVGFVVSANLSSDLPKDKIKNYVNEKNVVLDEGVDDLIVVNTGEDDDGTNDSSNVENVSVIEFNEKKKTINVISVALSKLDGINVDKYASRIKKNTKLNTKYYLTINYDDLLKMAEFIGRPMTMTLAESDVEPFNENQDKFASKYGRPDEIQKMKEGVQSLNPLQVLSYADIHIEGYNQTNDLHFRNMLYLEFAYLDRMSLYSWEPLIKIMDSGKNNIDEQTWLKYCAAFNTYKIGTSGVWLEGKKKIEYAE